MTSTPPTAHVSVPITAEDKTQIIHPWWLRMTHWLNALAVFIMLTSGWRIYDASPIFAFRIPQTLTLGGWLAGALQWHFAERRLDNKLALQLGAIILILHRRYYRPRIMASSVLGTRTTRARWTKIKPSTPDIA